MVLGPAAVLGRSVLGPAMVRPGLGRVLGCPVLVMRCPVLVLGRGPVLGRSVQVLGRLPQTGTTRIGIRASQIHIFVGIHSRANRNVVDAVVALVGHRRTIWRGGLRLRAIDAVARRSELPGRVNGKQLRVFTIYIPGNLKEIPTHRLQNVQQMNRQACKMQFPS